MLCDLDIFSLHPEPPQIVIAPNNSTETIVGQTVLFTCVSSGMPLPLISWSREGETLGSDSRVNIYVEEITENGMTFVQSVLEICSSEEMDSGEYTCSAESTLGNDSASFDLVVFVAPGEFILHMYMLR